MGKAVAWVSRLDASDHEHCFACYKKNTMQKNTNGRNKYNNQPLCGGEHLLLILENESQIKHLAPFF